MCNFGPGAHVVLHEEFPNPLNAQRLQGFYVSPQTFRFQLGHESVLRHGTGTRAFPVLSAELVSPAQSGSNEISMGDTVLYVLGDTTRDYMRRFRLFLCTPHFKPAPRLRSNAVLPPYAARSSRLP